ncbi:glycosyltransferase family 2 protein [Mesonia sp.]|uniref:glycosyltransferase family 2 protein n=1 Tax=Mesonia sp. TaxID=1960830 RepID=UPI00177A2861|nr:glycosyltransferase family 2 protein [Mesonia sp.]HIB36096.1 glycosyltransferase family 2 protein [Mesonia sp.]HIO26579.1 glycosyltransferase family 2 protein [Flavobacteriaceae bacterium]
MPKFSVIIPLYNKEKYISATIESVLHQSFQEFEVLVINDCSTDQSLKVIQQINDDRVKVIQHRKNSGLSASRNTGIKAARGKIITFLDADDLWKEDFLFHIDQLSKKFTNCDIFATDYWESYKHQMHSTKKNLKHIYKAEQYIQIEDFFNASLFNPIYCFSSVAFSKKAIDEVGLFDENISYGEDIDYNIRMNTKFNLAYSCKPCAVYRLGVDKQMTASGIVGKSLPNLSSYRNIKTNKNLDLYINMKYYYYASQFKKAKDHEMLKKYMKALNFSQLSKKQILLLKSPYWFYKFLKQTKAFLLKKGIKVTPY